MKKTKSNSFDFKPNDEQESNSSYGSLIQEELEKIKYSSGVKTLKDMTSDEIAKIEQQYNCKVRRSQEYGQ